MTGAQIKEIRRRLGWSQRKLAGFLNVHTLTVSRWERGEAPPKGLADQVLHAIFVSLQANPEHTIGRLTIAEQRGDLGAFLARSLRELVERVA